MAKKQLSAKQKAALEKGQNLMKSAVLLQKNEGLKKKKVYCGGKSQSVNVYKLNLSDALQTVVKNPFSVKNLPIKAASKVLPKSAPIEIITETALLFRCIKTLEKYGFVDRSKDVFSFTIEPKNYTSERFFELLNILPKVNRDFKSAKKKLKINSGVFDDKNLIIKAPSVDFSKKRSSDDIFSTYRPILRNNPLRPVMEGVYFDANGYAVASDLHLLVAVKTDRYSDLNGKIISKTGVEIEGRYPDWFRLVDFSGGLVDGRITFSDFARLAEFSKTLLRSKLVSFPVVQFDQRLFKCSLWVDLHDIISDLGVIGSISYKLKRDSIQFDFMSEKKEKVSALFMCMMNSLSVIVK